MTNARNEVDLRWAPAGLARKARKIFRRIRRDGRGRMHAGDMRLRFGRHGDAMLDAPEYRDGSGWAELCGGWREALKDWGVCAGVAGYAIGGEG